MLRHHVRKSDVYRASAHPSPSVLFIWQITSRRVGRKPAARDVTNLGCRSHRIERRFRNNERNLGARSLSNDSLARAEPIAMAGVAARCSAASGVSRAYYAWITRRPGRGFGVGRELASGGRSPSLPITV